MLDKLEPLDAQLTAYLRGRGISQAVLERNGVMQEVCRQLRVQAGVQPDVLCKLTHTSPTRQLPRSSGAMELLLCQCSHALLSLRAAGAEKTLTTLWVLQLRFSGKAKAWQPFIAFVYRLHGEVTNVKYRSLQKEFMQVPGAARAQGRMLLQGTLLSKVWLWQLAGAEPLLYGLDDAKGCAEVVFVEGEIDKLSLATAGIHNTVRLAGPAAPAAPGAAEAVA